MRVHTHYDNLKVARDAPIEVIHAAYSVLLSKYHPDQHPRAAAIINKAHEVLSDPVTRRLHDEWIKNAEREPLKPEPVAESAESRWPDPRRRRPSPIPDDWETPPQPAPRYSAVIGAGIVGALILAVIIVAIFLPQSQHAPTPSPSRTLSPDTAVPAVTQAKVEGGIIKEPAESKSKPLDWDKITKESGGTISDTPTDASESPTPTPVPVPRNYACRVMPNGEPWPQVSGYVGNDQDRAGGLSSLTIDNEQNNSNKSVKLVDHRGRAVRQLFVLGHESFTIRKVAAGMYTVSYLDLAGCQARESEPHELTETGPHEIEEEPARLTLYTVLKGNTASHPISIEDFLRQ